MKIIPTLAIAFMLLPCGSAAQQGAVNSTGAEMFSYDAAAPLEMTEQGLESIPGAAVHSIFYTSSKGGRVPAYLVVPSSGKGPFAAVLFLHWGQGNRTEFLYEAAQYARGGTVSLLIDAPYLRPGFKEFDPFSEPEKERAMYIQLMTDLRRGIDLLQARSDVDPRRIGYVGHSLGATQGGTLVGIDKRLKVAVFMGGVPQLTALEIQMLEQQGRKLDSKQREHFLQIMAPIDSANFVGRAIAPILFQFAKHDRFVSKAFAEDYIKAATGPKQVRWYYCSHEFNDPRAFADRQQFLSQKIGIRVQPAH
jgi:cephalosporin-C deacetylase-like acetyl esterase